MLASYTLRPTIVVELLNAVASSSHALSVDNCGHTVMISFLYFKIPMHCNCNMPTQNSQLLYEWKSKICIPPIHDLLITEILFKSCCSSLHM